MKAAETHKMSDAELIEESDRLRKRLFELRSQAVTEKLEDPKQIGQMKRDIARLLTEKRSREIAAAQAMELATNQETA